MVIYMSVPIMAKIPVGTIRNEQKAGRIHAAGMVKEVAFEAVAPGNINTKIDDAYKKKYSNSPYLSPMIGNRASAATVRIVQG